MTESFGVDKKDFVEIGDTFIVKIEGLPVAHAEVFAFEDGCAVLEIDRTILRLPMAVHDYEEEDANDGTQ